MFKVDLGSKPENRRETSPNQGQSTLTGGLVFVPKNATKKSPEKNAYFSGTYIDERDAPIPGVPCLTGLLVIANSPK